MMDYLYLLLSSACSLVLVHLLKITEVKKLRTVNTLTVNYLVAGAVAFVIGWNKSTLSVPGESFILILMLFSVVTGAFFIGNFFAFSKSVHTNGMGVSVVAMRLSLLVPVLISVFAYDELLNIPKITGIILVFGALIMLIPARTNIKFGTIDATWLLVIVFLLSGFADASLKLYEEEFSMQINEMIFMSIVFAGAFLIGLFYCSSGRSAQPIFTGREFTLGALIGIPNLFSSVFLIYALGGISGAIAFPMVNILNVLGGTVLGIYRWGDQVTFRQWVGIVLAVAAIILLL